MIFKKSLVWGMILACMGAYAAQDGSAVEGAFKTVLHWKDQDNRFKQAQRYFDKYHKICSFNEKPPVTSTENLGVYFSLSNLGKPADEGVTEIQCGNLSAYSCPTRGYACVFPTEPVENGERFLADLNSFLPEILLLLIPEVHTSIIVRGSEKLKQAMERFAEVRCSKGATVYCEILPYINNAGSLENKEHQASSYRRPSLPYHPYLRTPHSTRSSKMRLCGMDEEFSDFVPLTPIGTSSTLTGASSPTEGILGLFANGFPPDA